MFQKNTQLGIFLPSMDIGGAERSMLKLAKGIAQRGYPVDLVLAHAVGPFITEVPDTVRMVDLKAKRVLSSLPALVRYLRSQKPSALLSVLHANTVAIWARQLARVPTRLIVSERNTLSSEAEHYHNDLRMRLMPYLAHYFYPLTDGVVAVSKGVAADLTRTAKIPENLVHVIYNPIITPELKESARAGLDHPWFLAGELPVILAVGRLTKQKDFPTLIHAYARARNKHPSRLMIIGEGEERPALEALIAQLGLDEWVKLPGFVPNPLPFMSHADLFVLSSQWEGLPGVLIEALYCGVPLIATDCPSGPREILADGAYGQLVPVGDRVALSDAISNALNGGAIHPPAESWQPYEIDGVVEAFIDVLFGRG